MFTMKTFRKAFLLFSVSVFVLSAASFSSALYNRNRPVSTTAAASSTGPAYYIVKEYNGNIGIFPEDSTQPKRTVHINVADLPDEDRYLLECGILVRSETELRELIEDYTG